MCGFAGIIQWDNTPVAGMITDAQLDAADERLAHRGPDGAGRWRDPHHPGCVLLHRRLSIVDKPGGAQPMANEDQSVYVVFNGEIYNHGELRRRLEDLGHTFASDHSDTEVLVHGWEQWNTGLPEQLTGMFAFAVWDSRQRMLFLARDRMGQKPLFYQADSGGITFSSTLPALVACGAKTRTSMSHLAGYLSHGYLPPPCTIYENTSQLPGGYWLCAGPDHCRIQRYWQPGSGAGVHDAPADLSTILAAAVASQMQADVPMACFLSGGIDSTIIAGLMQRHARKAGSGRIQTINISFSESAFDETAYARMAARHIGSEPRAWQFFRGAGKIGGVNAVFKRMVGHGNSHRRGLPEFIATPGTSYLPGSCR